MFNQDVVHEYCLESFFRLFVKEYSFAEESRGSLTTFKVSTDYGEGSLEKYKLRNGLGVHILRIRLSKAVAIAYDIHLPLFEVYHCMSGKILLDDAALGRIEIIEGQFNLFLNEQYRGNLIFPAGIPIECVSVVAYYPEKILFADSDCSERQKFQLIRQNHAANFAIPRPIVPAMNIPVVEIEQCDLTGIAKLIYMEGKALEVISLAMDRVVMPPLTESTQPRLSEEDVDRIVRAERIVAERLADPLSIPMLAKAVSLNTYKLKEGFKQVYGTTIYAYIKNARMEKAGMLLIQRKDLNINEIVNEVGYHNTGHFAKAFREKWGVNPRDFRFRM